MVKFKDTQFCLKNLKMKRKKRTQNHGYGATLKKMKLMEKRQSQHATLEHANVAVLR